MGRQIIKQPNGKYCIFDSTVDNITHYDMSVDEIIEDWANECKIDIAGKVQKIVDKLEKGEKPYFQFTLSYANMLDTIESVHGKKESENVNLEILSGK